MSSLPKWIPEPGKGGGQTDRVSDERDATAVLTPPPSGAPPSEEIRPSDAPTMVDARLETGVPPSASDAPTLLDAGPSRPPTSPRNLDSSERMLPAGTILGNRYEIVSLLGEGGMGAVYKANDRELNLPVALKVIRPEYARQRAIIERFKQELLLAREVTHRNVIRIYDLGEADRIKFITMEYVEGEDLRALLGRKRKLSPEEAIDIIQQVCRALEAAHNAGIIHRDLKPQNIMQDKSGRILVMDFGLARSVGADGMTQTGALVGTMDYMSPEQALGKTLDQRSDLYTVGLIFYELLTGKMPFADDSALASLIKRTQQRAAPVLDSEKSIPESINNIVAKCLERDLNLRYHSATELLADLDAWQGKRAGAALTFHANVGPWGRTLHWPLIATVLTVIVLAIGAWLLRARLFAPSGATGPQVSLAILPFRNASGDASLDWLGASLSDMLSTDVGQSARLRTISSERLHQVLSDLQVTPGIAIDPTTVRRIAEFSSADTVVWGQYAKFGDQIRVDATLQDLKRDRRVPLKIEGVSEKDIPAAVDKLAENIRQNLAISPDIVAELKASSYQPTSKSAEALRTYNQGLQLLRQGKNLDALKSLQAAIKADSQFALAYARLAEAESSLGYDGAAEQHSRRAVDLAEQLPVAEKYLIQANHARIMKDSKKAIEAYENLAKTQPDNAEVEYALGTLYLDQNDFDKARLHYANVLKGDPKNLNALMYKGWIEVKAGKPEASLDLLNRALSLSVQTDNKEEQGQILQALGVAYEGMNKSDEALRNLQQAMAINRTLDRKGAVANSLIEIAHVQMSQGQPDAALRSFNDALKLFGEIGARKEAGDILIDMGVLAEDRGKYDEALQLYKRSLETERDFKDENYEALCLNNIGNVYLAQGRTDDAVTYYGQALQLRQRLGVPGDLADTLHNLGESYARGAQYDQAMTSYMRALQLRRDGSDRRGAALESHAIGMVSIDQGRYGAAVNSLREAVDTFHSLNDNTRNMAEILGDFAEALGLAGTADQAQKPMQEALGLARELKNDTLMSDLLNTQGDLSFFRGDFKHAEASYQQALQTATKAKNGEKILSSKVNLAKAGVADGRHRSIEFRELTKQAETLGLKYIALESSVLGSESLILNKDYSQARQQLEDQLGQAEKLGLRSQTAQIHYLLGNALRLDGNASDASVHYRRAAELLDEMKKEPGAEKILDRVDLKPVYQDCSRLANSSAN